MAVSYCSTNQILVGIGGTGGKILRAFKMRMFEEFPEETERRKQPVALLYVDSTREMMGIGRPDFRVMGLDASFTENEFLFIKDVDVENLLDNINNYPSVKGIVNNVSAVKTAIGALGEAAGQKRRAGRLLFAANVNAYVNALKDAYGRCDSVSHNAVGTTIHIFAGLCGGTGSGAIIDAIVQARKTYPDAIINVYAMIPEMNLPKANMDQGRYYQNGYAALVELNALQADRFHPHDVTSVEREAKFFSDKVKGVANGLTLYSNVNENGMTVDSLTELPQIVSDYIYSRVFLINSQDDVNSNMIRAFTFENMDDFALEYDETKNAGPDGRVPIARTKKVNSFGVKRVMYPELRILKHITYSIGESVLMQFKYNHWRDNVGYVDETENKDYIGLYFNEKNLSSWMLDNKHLLYEQKVLKSDPDYPSFNDYWRDRVSIYVEDAKKADCPLTELDGILGDIFENNFRKSGAPKYFKDKESSIEDIAREIRRTIEQDLFSKWKVGDISIVDLQTISKKLLEKVANIRKEIEEKSVKESEELEAIKQDCDQIEDEWSSLNIFERAINKGNRLFVEYQNQLSDLYTSKTNILALDFAKKLAARVLIELQRFDTDISSFGELITKSIEETERLIAAQRKVNKGLEDMKGAVIEVCEEDAMAQFEKDLKMDKVSMANIANQLRESILPQKDFVSFGDLLNDISVDCVKDAFDLKLSSIVKTKHNEKVDSAKKVLGLNILTQLKQKLTTDEDIQRFALEVVRQSGVYLKLDNGQMQRHVRNNEGNLSPTNAASINKKTILVSIPSPDKNDSLKAFADKLEFAFKNSFAQGNQQTSLVVNQKSPRENELSIVTVSYCYPIRCLSWMTPYRDKYEQFLHTGNPNTDASNAILLHTEGNGSQFPSLFVVDNAEEIAAKSQNEPPMVTSEMPPVGGMTPPVLNVQFHIHVNGQNYGPYDMETLKVFAKEGRLSPSTLVWKEGMANWTQASSVAELQQLFAPSMPPMPGAVPPVPPTSGSVPPVI